MAAGANRKRALQALARKLELPAGRHALVELALTHSSYASEHAADQPPVRSNERLEFLGDAVLGAIVASAFYEGKPDLTEGRLSRLRAALVSRTALAGSAARLGLGELVLLGRGEEATGGARRPSVLADVFEALVGAMFLAGGFAAAERFVTRHHLAHAALAPAIDPKTALQESAQARYKKAPHYAIIAQSGPPHARIFTVAVDVAGRVLGRGAGTTKKQAEAAAAREALANLP